MKGRIGGKGIFLFHKTPIGHIGVENREGCGDHKTKIAQYIGKGKFALPELVHFFEMKEGILQKEIVDHCKSSIDAKCL